MNTGLRDNQDGTCNCRKLGYGCFFIGSKGGRCDCKCHNPMTKSFEERLEDFAEINEMYEECRLGKLDQYGAGGRKPSHIVGSIPALPTSQRISRTIISLISFSPSGEL